MDGSQFDELSRRLVKSRRSAMATLLSMAGGLATGLAGESRRKKKKNKKKHGGGKNGSGTTQPPTNNFPAGAIRCAKHADCPTGLRCHPAGFCECFPGFCTGCCVDETHCLMLGAMTDDACGYDGLACVPCPDLTRCTNTEEQCRCDAESNPQGCCLGPQHRTGFPGTTSEHCGRDGEDCAVCATGDACIDQVCRGGCAEGSSPCGEGCCPDEHCCVEDTCCSCCTRGVEHFDSCCSTPQCCT